MHLSVLQEGNGMKLRDWSKSNIDYGRRLFVSGLEGARSGEARFLQGRALTPVMNDYARHAITSATIGACLGVITTYPPDNGDGREKALASRVVAGAVGGLI